MKKIWMFLCIGFGLTACFDDETIHADYVDYGRGYDTLSTDATWEFVSQYYYKYGKEIILDPDTSDYMFNFQTKNEVTIVPPQQSPENLASALQFLREMFLDGYNDDMRRNLFPYAIILADTITNTAREPYTKVNVYTASSYVAFLVNDEMRNKTEEEKEELSRNWNTTFLNYCMNKIGWTAPEEFYLFSTDEEFEKKENWWIPIEGATADTEPVALDVVWERGYPTGKWDWNYGTPAPGEWLGPKEWGYAVSSSRKGYLDEFIKFLLSTPQDVIDAAIAKHEKLRKAHDILDTSLKEKLNIDYRKLGYKANK